MVIIKSKVVVFSVSGDLSSEHIMFKFSSIGLIWAGVFFALFHNLQAAPLEYKVFSTDANVYIVQPNGLLSYSRKSRDFNTIVLDQSRTRDSILDVQENDGLLWFLTPQGVYQFDMNTTTLEKIPFLGETACNGKITADFDYVWVACPDSLMQFDKLGREWLTYAITHKGPEAPAILSAFSNGDEVFCAFPEGMRVFYTIDEKWNDFPLPNRKISPNAKYVHNKDNIVLVDEKVAYRYITTTKSWETIAGDSKILDLILDEQSICYNTQNKAYLYPFASSMSQRFDIQGLANVKSVAKISDTTYALVSEKNLLQYDIKSRSIEFIPYSEGIIGKEIEKIIFLGDILLAFSPDKFGLYDFSNKLWESTSRRNVGGGDKRFSWDNKGMSLKYKRGYNSSLKGSIEKELQLKKLKPSQYAGLVEADSGETVLGYTFIPTDIDLTLHNTYPGERYFDLYVNNTSPSEPAEKLLKYRGGTSDVVQDAIAGNNKFTLSESQTLPQTQYEGARVVMESKKKLKNRDRKVLRVSSGAGFITSQSINTFIPYNSRNDYRLKSAGSNSKADTTKIIPGSFKIWIDGERLDSTYYTYNLSAGTFEFFDKAPVDPSSIIKIQYQVETIPDEGIEKIEPLPENKFATMGYVDVLTSYTDWLSTRVSYVPLKSNTDTLSHLLHAAVPLELRRKNLFFKANPELTYNPTNSAKAVGLSLYTRLMNKASLTLKSLVNDTNFTTTDNLSTSYGKLKSDLSYSLSYDLNKDLTLSFSQSLNKAERGDENRYEIELDGHLPNYPYFKVNVSRNLIEANPLFQKPVIDKISDTLVAGKTVYDTTYKDTLFLDTLDRKKDKVRLTLYETSSPILESALHFNKVGYQFIWTEFISNDFETDRSDPGRVFFGNTVLSPINAMTFTSVTTYQKNPVSAEINDKLYTELELQTIDAPRGIDFSSRYALDFRSYVQTDSCEVQLDQSLSLIVKPGAWFPALSWFSPRGSIQNSAYTPYADRNPGNGKIFFGDKKPLTSSVTKSLGTHIIPNEDIFFSTKTDWNQNVFKTANDLKFWFNSKRMLWQTFFNYNNNTEDTTSNFRGYSRYDNTWSPWFRTTQGLFATYAKDTSGAESSFGPHFTVGINIREKGFIKRILNDHTLNIDWSRGGNKWVSSIPGISYEIRLRLMIKPNISFDLLNILGLDTEGSGSSLVLKTYEGRFKMQAFF